MKILVYIEHEAGAATDISMQLLAAGNSLPDAHVMAFCAAGDTSGMGAQVLNSGAAELISCEHDAFSTYLGRAQAKALSAAVRETRPDLVLLPASTVGNDLGPLTAAMLGAACVTDCDGLQVKEEKLLALRTEYDTRARVAYEACDEGAFFLTFKDGISETREQEGPGDKRSMAPELGDADLRVAIERREVAAKTVNLKDANIIIGGGAGVGTQENFALLESLAKRLGGEIGATRASADAGWVSAERQIGQTGVTVKPDLYIACGISGAVQHVVGIRDAKTIVAINSDAGAPIFRVSHYKIVGDLNVVIPKLIDLMN